MKPLETEQSTFAPGGEERSYYDNFMFNAAGTAKIKHPLHPKGQLKKASPVHHAKPVPSTPHAQPQSSELAGHWVKLKKGAKGGSPRGILYDTYLDGSVKKKGYPQIYEGMYTRDFHTKVKTPLGVTYLLSTEPTVIDGITFYEVLKNNTFNSQTGEFLREGGWRRKSFPATEKSKAFLRRYLINPQSFQLAEENSYLDQGSEESVDSDYNASGNEKHYPGQWMFTRSLSLYYWDVKDKKFKMYANDPKHVMLHNLPFTVSRHTDTPTHKFYHVYAPGFDTDNIWITASAMRKYAKPYAAKDTGEYNAEGTVPATSTTVEGETPIWADVLPIIGLGAGLFAAYKLGAKDGSKAVIGQYIAFGSCGMGLFSIPKVYLQMKALDKVLSGKK